MYKIYTTGFKNELAAWIESALRFDLEFDVKSRHTDPGEQYKFVHDFTLYLPESDGPANEGDTMKDVEWEKVPDDELNTKSDDDCEQSDDQKPVCSEDCACRIGFSHPTLWSTNTASTLNTTLGNIIWKFNKRL